MRSGVLGLCLYRDDDDQRLRDFVKASTRITHTDPRAVTGALFVALAVREIMRSKGELIDPAQFLNLCRENAPNEEWLAILTVVEQSLERQDAGGEFAASLGQHRGISGYIIHTVAAVLFCWLRWPGEFRRPIEEIIRLGGDTDSTAAILGGLVGAQNGPESIPPEWLDRLVEWPYSVSWMRLKLADELRQQFGNGQGMMQRIVPPPLPAGLNVLAIFGRNLVFLAIVLAHGIRRLLPPY